MTETREVDVAIVGAGLAGPIALAERLGEDALVLGAAAREVLAAS